MLRTSGAVSRRQITHPGYTLLRLSLGVKILALILLGIAALLVARLATISSAKSTAAAIAKDAITVQAVGRGRPYLNFQDGRRMLVDYKGEENAAQALRSQQAQPRSLASADLDRNATPDLIAGYAWNGAGIVTVQRGNPDAFAPTDESVYARMQQGYNPDSLLPDAEVYQVPEPVDFLQAGDFDDDNRMDVLVGARGGDLFLLAGDGYGGLKEARRIDLPGAVTTVTTGEFRAFDGKLEIAVGVDGSQGAQLLVYDGAEGGLKATPMKFELPDPATAAVFGNFDSDPFIDLAVAVGSDIEFIHGWGRKTEVSLSSRVETFSAGANIRDLSEGFYVWNRESKQQLAIITEDGAVHLLQRGAQNELQFSEDENQVRAGSRARLQRSPAGFDVEKIVGWTGPDHESWTVSREVPGESGLAGGISPKVLSSAHIAPFGTDSLLVVGRSNHNVQVVQESRTSDKNGLFVNEAASRPAMASIDLTTNETAVAVLALPKKLNGQRSVVVLQSQSSQPAIVPLLPTATPTVDRTDDPAVTTAGSGAAACTGAANDCSLRGAVLVANANPGSTITIPAGTYTLSINGNGGCTNESVSTGNQIGDLEVNADNTTIMGNGSTGGTATIIIQTGTGGAGGDRVMCLDASVAHNIDYTFSGFTVAGGRDKTAIGGGGIIGGAKDCTLSLTDVRVANNQTKDSNNLGGLGGGGISIEGGSLTITNSTIGGTADPGATRTDLTLGNSAETSGGALFYSPGDPFGATGSFGTLTITGSTISHNTANALTAGGGGLDLTSVNTGTVPPGGGSASINNCTFSNNKALGTASGGAIIVESLATTIGTSATTTSFSNNTAGNRAGGISVAGASLTLDATLATITFTGNTAGTPETSTISTSSLVTAKGTHLTLDGDLEVTSNGTWTNENGTGVSISPTNIVIQGPTTAATWNSNDSTVNVAGNLKFLGTNWAFNAGTGEFNFNGTTAQAITNASTSVTFNKLTDSNTTQPLTLNNSIAVNNNLTINGANAIFDPVAAAVISGAGTLIGTGTARVRRTAATADFSSQYTITNKTLTNLTVEYIGAAGQTASALTYGGLKINNASNVTLAAGTSTVNNTLTLQTGGLGVGTNTLVINNGTSVGSGSLTSAVTGTVNYNQGSPGQNVLAFNYGNLTFSNFNKVLPNGSTVGVAGTFTPGSATGHTITGNTFDFNGAGTQSVAAFNYNNLTISGNRGLAQVTLAPSTIGVAGTFNPSATNVVYVKTSNVFNFNGATTQTVAPFNYNDLTISGNRGGATVTLGSPATIGIFGVFTTSATNVVYSVTGSTVEFNGTAAQTMPSTFTTYNNLTLNNAAGVTPFAGLTVNALLEVKAGTFTSNSSTYKNVQIDNTTTLAGTSATTINVTGNWTNNGTFTANTNALNFNGSSAQQIGGANATTFNDLTINNATGVTVNNGAAAVDATVGGALTLTTDLTIAPGAILQQSGTSAGTGDVIGTVRRTDLGVTARAFGNPFNTISIDSGTAPTQMDATLVKSAPVDFTGAVKRTYTLTPTGGAGFSATVQLHYLDSELNGNTEATLGLWQKGATWISRGRTSQDTANNFVALSGVTSFSDWTIASMPDVTVTVSPASVKEDGATNLVYTFARNGNVTGPLTINFSVGGTATFITDYGQTGANTFNSSAGTVTFLAGNANATVTIDPVNDNTPESNETVDLTVTTGAGYNVGSPSLASGTITNDDTTTTILSDNPDPSSAGQTVTVTYTVVGAGGTPTGNVQVSDGVDSNTCTVLAGSCPLILNTQGNRNIVATYQGDVNFNGSTSASEPHVVCGSPVVTTIADTGAGSLRQTIIDACDGATVTFDTAGVFATPQTIPLASELSVAKNVSIVGPATGVTLSGGGTTRVFNISSGTVNISNLTVSGGKVTGTNGAGLLNTAGTVTLTGMLFTGNTAVNGGGGAIASFGGTLNLYNSTIDGNTATNGGGVAHDTAGTVALINDTITSNTANGDVGGGPVGGGGDSGGVGSFNAVSTTARNTIIALNSAGTNADSFGVTDSGNNLIGTDPLVAALADNGGASFTRKLQTGSPAIDTGDNTSATNAGLTTDQRGPTFPRIIDGDSNATATVDIGAYERAAPPVAPNAPNLDDSSDSGPSNADNYTSDNTPTFTISGVTVGATVQLFADNSPVASGVAAGASIQLTSALVTDGTHTFVAQQTVSGDTSANSSGLSVTIDTVPPATPTIDLQAGSDSGSSSSDNITNATTRTFDIGGTEANATVGLFRDANPITSGVSAGGTIAISDGTAFVSGTTYAYTAKQTDLAGNSSSASTAVNVQIDSTAPAVSSSVRVDADPTSLASVQFTVTFSENVTGVDLTDFTLTTTGSISGASVTNVTGGPAIYTVTVNTGTNDGTLRLDVTDNDSIADVAGNPLGGPGAGNGNFTGGESYLVDRNPPSVSSIVRANTNPTNAASVNFTVTFSEGVTGVDTTDFALTTTGVAGASISTVTPVDSSHYTVAVNTGTGDGTIRLDVIDDDSIKDAANRPLGDPGAGNGNFTTGEVYTIDKTAPTVSSIIRADSNPTNAANVNFTVTFSESVTGVDQSDFALTTAGVAGASISGVSGSGSTYTVTVSTGTGSGTIRLDLTDDDTIKDAATNPLGGAGAGNGNFIAGQVYTVDKTAPTVSSSNRAGSNPTNAASVNFTVTFSESVTGVDVTDFSLTTTGVSGASVSNVSGGGSTYTITVNTGTGDGTIRLDVADNDSITDAATNPLGGTGVGNGNFIAGQVYTVDKTAPTADIIDVTPDPRNTTVSSITIVFSQAVTGFDLADLSLKLNGGANLLSGAQTLTSGDNITWTLNNLSGITGAEGIYTLTLTAAGSNITDNASNALAANASDSWTMDTTAPSVTINQAAGQSDPGSGPTVDFTAVFNEAVTGFDPTDVTLSGSANPTTAVITEIAPNNGTTYNVAVSGMIANGTVVASVKANAAQDAAGNNSTISTSSDNTVNWSLCTNNPVVTTNTDAGAGSLRQAILDSCDGSTITFNAGVVSPITLTSGELLINKNLTITGPDANLLTISGNNASRIFNIQSGKTVIISGLTLNNGNTGGGDGGGVLNGGTLTLTDCAVMGNTGGNGGGITNATGGTLTITGSTISGNTAPQGAGITDAGQLTLINSTISGNTGDGLSNATGAIANLTNDTFSGNSIRGITSNPGSTTNIRNTIVVNTPGAVSDINGTFNSQGNNFIGKSNGSAGLTNGVNNDQVGTIATPLNALLAALGNYGGPTQTHALLPGSTAIDTGNSCVTDVAHCGDASIPQLTTDQRGFGRQVNGTVDIGAFESRGFAIAATSGTPQSTAINTAFASSLVATVTSAFGEPVSGGQVTFTAPGAGASSTFTGGVTTINVAINGSSQASTSATANGTAGGPYNVTTAGNGLGAAANFSLTNTKGNQTITFSALADKTFGDPDFAVSATASSGLPAALGSSGNCTVTSPSPGTVHIIGAGSCTITASQAGDANYNAAPSVPQSFTINKANQTITFNALVNKTFGDADFGASATASSGLAVSLAASGNCTVTSPSPGTVHIAGTGSCTITASQAGNANFNAAANVPQSFTIARAATATALTSAVNPSDLNQSVTFTGTVTSNGGTPTGTVQFKDNGVNLGAPVALNASGVAQFSTSALATGPHPITADYSGDGNFGVSTGTLAGGQVVKPQPSLSINDVAIAEGDAGTKVLNFTVTLSAASNLTVTTNYATADSTATAPSDYAAIASTLLTFNPGDTSKQIAVTINGDIGFEADETFTVNLTNPTNATISKAAGTGTIQNDDAQGGFLSFSSISYSVNENAGVVTVTVVRTNDVSQAANVDYATDDTGASTNCAALNTGLASQRCDYTSMFGTLKFAANETQKTVDIPINLDAYTEGPEVFKVNLSNATGGAVLNAPTTATVTISDSASPAANAIDDTTTFVRQQYRDFLNRDADAAGLAFWKNNIDKCNDPAQRPPGQTLAQCLEVQRIITSAAFFLSIEFRGTGGLVRDFYVATLNRPATGNMPEFVEFMRDTQAIQKGVIVGQGNWQQTLSGNQQAFMLEFVMRAEFVGLYPTTDTPTQYVNKIYQHAALAPNPGDRAAAIAEFGAAVTAADPGARARALLRITQDPAFQARELPRGFVQMQYLGYLRRNPNDAPDGNFNGYNFWLNKLNQFNGDFLQAEMVKAFLSSLEYRSRFGP